MDGGELRQSHSGNDPGGANGARADTDFDRGNPRIHEIDGAFFRDHISRNHRGVAQGSEFGDDVEHPVRVAGRGIDENRINTGLNQGLSPFPEIFPNADRGPYSESSHGIFGGIEIAFPLLNILAGDQPHQMILVINQGQFLDPIVIQYAAGFVLSNLTMGRDELRSRSHDIGNLAVGMLDIPNVTGRHHAFQFAFAADDGKSIDAFLLHDALEFLQCGPCLHRERIADDHVLGSFDPGDHSCLIDDGAIPVNHPKSPFPGQSDGKFGLGDGIHRRGDHGNVQGDLVRKPRGEVGIPRQNPAAARNQQDVIETECEWKVSHSQFLERTASGSTDISDAWGESDIATPHGPCKEKGPMLREALQKHFGFESFRPGQEQVIQSLLEGRSALALFPTGAGKSICYQLPAILLEGTALVISPLIALMKDQVDALKRRGIAAARLDSTLSSAEASDVLAQLRKGTLKLLYLAPERLVSESFMNRLREVNLSLLAIDEAHCISEWGHNFRPEYLRLAKVARELAIHPILALTATATPPVARDICRAFAISEQDHAQTSFHRPNLNPMVTPVTPETRDAVLEERLKNRDRLPAIVYVTLQETAECVATRLQKSGLSARAYHAGMHDDHRSEAQEHFMSGRVDIIVATIAFGMGIDKADIRGVIHYNLPKTLENYQQEAGRAGRDGKPAICEILATAKDLVTLENFIYGDTPTESALRVLVSQLLQQGAEFDISRYDLALATDIRATVIETAITYLELAGAIEPLGAFYTTHRIAFSQPPTKILHGHPPQKKDFLRQLFAAGQMGRKYLTLDLDVAAEQTGRPREQVLRALAELEEQGDISMQLSGLRHRFRLGPMAGSKTPRAWAGELHSGFQRHEKANAERLQQVIRYACTGTCLTRALLMYFGEMMDQDCGHCSGCANPGPDLASLPGSSGRSILTEDLETIRQLMGERHAALRQPRQLARFLCGLTSPATTRARLGRHDLFGSLHEVAFQDVLAQLESSNW